MWHLPSLASSTNGTTNSTTSNTTPLNLGTEPHQITSNSETMQQSSVKDEFNNSSTSSYSAGADYSLQNLDSYYKSNSSVSAPAESSDFKESQSQQQPPVTVKSDEYSAPTSSSSTEHVSSHYDYPAYYSTV